MKTLLIAIASVVGNAVGTMLFALVYFMAAYWCCKLICLMTPLATFNWAFICFVWIMMIIIVLWNDTNKRRNK